MVILEGDQCGTVSVELMELACLHVTFRQKRFYGPLEQKHLCGHLGQKGFYATHGEKSLCGTLGQKSLKKST